MRVIHHDGRVGKVYCNLTVVPEGREVRFWFGVAPLTYERVKAGDLRPLGTIEEELRSLPTEPNGALVNESWLDLSPEAWDLFFDSVESNYGPSWAMSEALEACARIWEQHGVAL